MFKDYSAYQHYQQAEKQHKKKAYKEALQALNKAIKIQPKESSFWILKGQILWLTEQKKSALRAYDKAANLNTDYFKPFLLRGMSHYELGNSQAAQKDFQKADSLLKTRLSAFYQGEIAFKREHYQTASKHYQGAASGSDELASMARDKLAQIQKLQQSQ